MPEARQDRRPLAKVRGPISDDGLDLPVRDAPDDVVAGVTDVELATAVDGEVARSAERRSHGSHRRRSDRGRGAGRARARDTGEQRERPARELPDLVPGARNRALRGRAVVRDVELAGAAERES